MGSISIIIYILYNVPNYAELSFLNRIKPYWAGMSETESPYGLSAPQYAFKIDAF